MAVSTKQLPAKESALFRSIVKCYEVKQYKKGLKAADQILKKHPEHGETLAMKGLTLNCMGRKEEAYDFVRNGLRHDLRSHVCWHVFGLLYRSDRNYNEAIKCYRNAIRIDPENLQILRDLYLLQVQMRDLKGFAETRRAMLTLKPNNRNNWIGFAIAHHLVGNLQMAIDIIEKYFSTLDGDRQANYEDSEIRLYENQLLEESGDVAHALQHLEDNRGQITDTLSWRQKKGQFLLQLERFAEARELFEDLLAVNFDNYDFHRGLQCALMQRSDLFLAAPGQKKVALPCEALDFAVEPKAEAMQTALSDFYASTKDTIGADSVLALRFPLDFTSGAQFKAHADVLLKKQLVKGVPSLGSDLKPLYADKAKVALLEELLVGYMETLEAKKPLVAGDNSLRANDTEQVLLWTRYLAAQHFDRLGQHAKAMELVEKCITQAPMVLDFVQRKARVLKHMGELQQAADVMEQARKLDLADRYINNKATEYLLHADRVEEADATIALFTRHEGDPQQNLFDMQCMWYELECGESQLRQRHFGLALKRFFAVEKHFQDFVEDQFDFHTYCIRKMTLRAYVQMLRLCDGIYGRDFFVEAAQGAIACYTELADEALKQTQADAEAAEARSNMSASDKKKAKRAQAKARKAEFKRKEEEQLQAKLLKEQEDKEREAERKNGKKPNAGAQRAKEPPKDDDPQGDKLAAKPPLDEAWRFVAILQQYAPADVKTHLAAFDLAQRKNKMLLGLQALLKAQALAESEAHKQALKTRRAQWEEAAKQVTNPVVLQVLQDKKSELTC